MIKHNVTEVRIFLRIKTKHVFSMMSVYVFPFLGLTGGQKRTNTRTRIDKITMDEFYCQLNKINTEKKH